MSQDEQLRARLIADINGLTSEELLATDRFLSQLPSKRSALGLKTIQPSFRGPLIQSGVEPPHSKSWPHAPLHRISEAGSYIVTAGTWKKQHHFNDHERLQMLESKLLQLAQEY